MPAFSDMMGDAQGGPQPVPPDTLMGRLKENRGMRQERRGLRKARPESASQSDAVGERSSPQMEMMNKRLDELVGKIDMLTEIVSKPAPGPGLPPGLPMVGGPPPGGPPGMPPGGPPGMPPGGPPPSMMAGGPPGGPPPGLGMRPGMPQRPFGPGQPGPPRGPRPA